MNTLDAADANQGRGRSPRLVTPVLKDAVLAAAPVSCQKLSASGRGLAVHRAVPMDVPFETVRLVAACHDHQHPKDAPVLLLFVDGLARPFIVSALNIAFREFSGVLGDTLAASFTNFLAMLLDSCRSAAVDGETWAFVQGQRPLAPRSVDVLATALSRAMADVNVTEAGDAPAASGTPAEERAADVAAIWTVGNLILGLYEVRKVHESGGMGLVYRVHHRGWQTDLAVKAPRPEFFRTEADVAAFERECETWINLGLHPHTVSCYYVRRLGGIPRVFAEYVDGGSLEDWISSRRLYQGDSRAALLRMLDLAIQVAWGLHFAHERGLIHQDVKPGNVLVTSAGVAKVTDFGLAHARAQIDAPLDPAPGGGATSLVATFGGLTPAYCSPEQAAMLAARRAGAARESLPPLTRRTDIWSWAVSVLEMFTGGVTWMGGQAAAAALAGYLQDPLCDGGIPHMPEPVARLLEHCFSREPAVRPATMLDVAAPLERAYELFAGLPYPRRRPEPATLLADGLNNRAVSLLDIGRRDDAERLFDEALAADGGHLDATINRALLRWRSGRSTDQAVIAEVSEVAKAAADPRAAADLVCLLHLERHDADAALAGLQALVSAGAPGRSDPLVRQRAESLRPHAARAIRVVESLPAALTAVAVSSNGRTAVAGGLDNTVQVWDVASGSLVKSLFGHDGWITSLAVTPDGRLAVSGSVDDTVRAWDVASGNCLRVLPGHSDDVKAVAVQGAGRWAASGGYDDTVRVWDLASGQCLRLLEGHTNWIAAVAVGRDSRIVLSASYDGTLRAWDAPTGRCLHVLEGHEGRVTTVSASSDARRAISGGADGRLRFWDVASGQCVGTFHGHAGEVTSASLSADGRFAVSGGADKTIRLWETRTGRCLRTFEGHAREVSAVALSADASIAVSSSVDRTLRAWNVRGLCYHPLPTPPALSRVTTAEASLEAEAAFVSLLGRSRESLASGRAEEAIALARDLRALAGRDRDPEVLGLWSDLACRGTRVGLRSAWCVRVMAGHSTEVRCLALTPDGRLLVSAAPEGALRVREVSTGRTVWTLDGHTHGISAIAMFPDGQRIASIGGDGRLCLWHLGTGGCERVIDGFEPNGEGLAISDDLRWILRGNGPNVGLWDVHTGRRVRSFPAPSSLLMNAVILLPGGEQAAAATIDYKTQMFELAGGRITGTMVTCGPLAVSPDARTLACVGLENNIQTIVTWDLKSGDRRLVMSGHSAQVTAMAFAPDSRWLLTSGRDNVVKVWDLSSGTLVRQLEGFVHPVCSLAMSPDGTRVAMGCGDGTVQVWALDWELAMLPPCGWDEAALPFLDAFAKRHRPLGPELPADRPPLDEELAVALARRGTPSWTPSDVDELAAVLGRAGFGHIRREGIVTRLQALAGEAAAVPAHGTSHGEAARILRKGADRVEAEVLPLLAGVRVEGNDLYQIAQIIVGVWRALAGTLETGKGAGGRTPSITDLALTLFGSTCQLTAFLGALGAGCPPHVFDTISRIRELSLDLLPAPSLPEATIFYSRKVKEAADALEAAFRAPLQPLPTEPIDMPKVLQQLVTALRAYPDLLARGLGTDGRPASRETLARLLGDLGRSGLSDHFQQVCKACFGGQFLSISSHLNGLQELAQLMEAQVTRGRPAPMPAMPLAAPAIASPAPVAPAGEAAPAVAAQAQVAPVSPAAAVAIECPKCGAAGQCGAECGSCGLLFARYRPGPVLKRAADRLRLVARQVPRTPAVVNEIAKFWDAMPDILDSGRGPTGEVVTLFQAGLLVRDNTDMLDDRLAEAFGECPAQLRSLLPEMRRLSRYLIGDLSAPAARAALADTVANNATALEMVLEHAERPFPVTDQGLDTKLFLTIFVNIFKGLPGQLTGETEPGMLRGTAEAVANSCATMLSANVLGVVSQACPSNFANYFRAVNMVRTAARLVMGQ